MHDISATDLLRAGHEHHLTGGIEIAEAFYRRAVQRDAAHVEARLKLAMVLQELGRVVEAAEVLGQVVVEDPRCAAAWVQLARAIASQGYAWEAHTAIRKALKGRLDADTLVALSMLQMTLLKDDDAAEGTARRAVKMSPRSAAGWTQLGQVLAIKGDKAQAAAAYEQALAVEPQNDLAGFYLAALNVSAGVGAGESNVTARGIHPADGGAPSKVAVAPPQYVRGLFDGCAEQFDAMLLATLQYRVPQLLDKVLSNWLAAARGNSIAPMAMLDAGCGTGLCGQWMARYRGRLIGVDLSRRMIAQARAREVYDELVPGELVGDLEKRSATLDLIVAADVMVYIGCLVPFFTAAAAALRKGGLFLFSVEAASGVDYLLRPTQRFAHSMAYLQRLAASSGLALHVIEESVLRLEKGEDVRGYLVLAEKLPRSA